MACNYPSPPASPKALDELLICSVCLESYRDPRTLACLHSFCTGCLENCRRPYRRDITCPLCKKVTLLPSTGVQGLQNDFRIQQIRDILLNISPTPSTTDLTTENDAGLPEANISKHCGFCEAQQKSVPAFYHCIQCCMCFCEQCNERHGSNHIFSSHHVVHLAESLAMEVLYCRFHKEHQVKYFCTTCKQMLCTICTMSHDMNHKPEPLERGIIEKYKKELQDSLKAIHSKLYEVKNKTKFLETVRETHQRGLYEAQVAIRAKTEGIICKVRQRERELLEEVQRKIDEKLKGMENLGDMKFYKSSIEQLCTEIQNVIVGSPQKCLLAYDDIKAKVQAIPEASLQLDLSTDSQSVIKFIPLQEDVNILIGSLQECSVSESSSRNRARYSDTGLSTVAETSDRSEEAGCSNSHRHAPYSPKSKKRAVSIMNALSPSKRTDVKMGKLKGEKTNHSHPRGKINADEVLGTQTNRLSTSGAMSLLSDNKTSNLSVKTDSSMTSIVTRSAANKPSTSSKSLSANDQPKQLFVIDQIGGWPGKISNPSSVSFMTNGNIVVAESDTRLQVFDRRGKSESVIGWGKCKPQSVAVRENGDILVADRKDCCIKLFNRDGELYKTWGTEELENGMPSGLAVSRCGNVIVTDAQRHMIFIFSAEGQKLACFGAWGSGNYQFNNPLYVATDANENILVADLGNVCIKVFDKMGKFQLKFPVVVDDPNLPIKPQGIAPVGNHIVICDRENHRVILLNEKGEYVKCILQKQDGVLFPCDVKISAEKNLIAVVENHSGFLSHERHHAVRVFELKLEV